LVVDLDTSTNLEAYNPEELLGKCNKLIVTKEDTILFFNERLNSDAVTSKITELESVIKNSNNKLEKEYLQDRISKLACGVSIIKVGGTTEVELKEKLDRVDDAINAVKSAISEGVVSGGGLTLFNASLSIGEGKKTNKGYSALKEAIKAPMSTILFNAGLKPKEIQDTLLTKEKNIGYDVKEYKYSDMFKSGIIDPAKAIRLALENAASVATTVLLTNTTITHKRDEGSIK